LYASALLSLGGCAAETFVSPEENIPTPIVPDANGMVTLRLSVANDDYENGTPQTRGGKAPIQFTQDLGDGYTLTSTLIAEPETRAEEDESSPLADGVQVLMLSFANDDTEENVPLGYQILEVSEGSIDVVLPDDSPALKLLFYSLNTDDPIEIDDYITYDEATEGTYHELTNGALKPVPITASEDAAPVTPDVLYALLTNITPAALGSLPDLEFNHPFAQITWMLVVDSTVEAIGNLNAGFYPRHANATFSLSQLASRSDPTGIEPASLWTGGDTETGGENAGQFFTNSYTAGDEQTDSIATTIRFIPVTEQPTFIYLASLQMLHVKGYKTVKDITLDIKYKVGNVENRMTFEAGRKYTVKSKITKGVYIAHSNIYWDGQTLTFDKERGGTTYKDTYQGVLFKFGSLVGISPHYPFNDRPGRTLTPLYIPVPDAQGYHQSYTTGTTRSWEDIPSWRYLRAGYEAGGNFIPNDGRATVENSEAFEYFGDICAYLTGGEWRMPNIGEIDMGGQGESFAWPTYREGEEDRIMGWMSMMYDVSPWTAIDDAWGTPAERDAGRYFLPVEDEQQTVVACYATLRTPWDEKSDIPPSGWRDAETGDTGTDRFGREAKYWSASPNISQEGDAKFAHSFGFDGTTMYTTAIEQRNVAMPVRCVK
jgi:hypothetical protein